MGPVEAIRKALERARLDASSIDLVELNEAFASQSLAVSRELGLDPSRVNVYGGAIALGHPIGASGARILTTLVHALHERNARYGVASLCVGGGMGTALIVERV
jgi:acetyl-CoA C-acetyltransferase